MECSELTALAVDGLLGESAESLRREVAGHLETCQTCREELGRIERAWETLGEDRDAPVTPEFRRRCLSLLEEEMLRQRIRAFRPSARWPRLILQVAALLLAAAGGYLAARAGVRPLAPAVPKPGLEPSAALANVSYRPADAQGRIGVSFDVTSRRTVIARPGDPEMASLLAYLVSRNTQTSGEKSRAIELVSSHYGAGVAAASPDIVRALTSTLKRDQNPGVRKKAADALAGFAMTPDIRTAFLDALQTDRNPAVRLTAIDALAVAAKASPDPKTIESLREKAFDPSENGFVRAKAASALKAIEF
ncbi:MAG TPA: HEAT repeat domain-containing protein [Thermoanaerobaculia bacterium]|nr:HEAT repeat domain-containing protein [Thermoanaerobaculia bacterium]